MKHKKSTWQSTSVASNKIGHGTTRQDVLIFEVKQGKSVGNGKHEYSKGRKVGSGTFHLPRKSSNDTSLLTSTLLVINEEYALSYDSKSVKWLVKVLSLTGKNGKGGTAKSNPTFIYTVSIKPAEHVDNPRALGF